MAGLAARSRQIFLHFSCPSSSNKFGGSRCEPEWSSVIPGLLCNNEALLVRVCARTRWQIFNGEVFFIIHHGLLSTRCVSWSLSIVNSPERGDLRGWWVIGLRCWWMNISCPQASLLNKKGVTNQIRLWRLMKLNKTTNIYLCNRHFDKEVVKDQLSGKPKSLPLNIWESISLVDFPSKSAFLMDLVTSSCPV